MKRILIAGSLLLTVPLLQAQQNSGHITYERVTKMMAHININGIENDVPQARKENFELIFGNNQSLWKAVEQENEETPGAADNEGGMYVNMIMPGSNDVLYFNFETGKRTEKRELLGKNFIVDDSIGSLKWKMTGESKTILNHNCMKAVATRISTQMQMTINDGKMERKEIHDTSKISAWFTNDIPVSAGPGEYQGQLPGLILEMDVSNGRQTFIATGISEKTDLALITEPTGKKHYTPAEFMKEREKMMKEMEQNNQGGNRQIRIN